ELVGAVLDPGQLVLHERDELVRRRRLGQGGAHLSAPILPTLGQSVSATFASSRRSTSSFPYVAKPSRRSSSSVPARWSATQRWSIDDRTYASLRSFALCSPVTSMVSVRLSGLSEDRTS